MLSILLLLIVPSALLYGLLVFHAVRNRGARAAALYFGSAALYGIVRAGLLRRLTGEDVLLPYLMTFPVLRIGVATLPEILGWGLAVSVSWLAADRLLRRAGIAPSPHRTAAVAAVGLACISFAVETAAIGAGWWTWTIKQPVRPVLGRVPPVGLLDWGFVAFDFLLPYLLLANPASWVRRLAALAIFPLHFLAHPRVMPLHESFPLSIDDLGHGFILAYVLASAVGERASAFALPDPQAEKLRWLPPIAALVIALATALASVLYGDPWSALASLPLLSVAVVAFLLPARFGRQPPAEASVPRGARRRGAAPSPASALPRLMVVLLVLAAVYALRASFHRHTRRFVAAFEEGVVFLNAGDLDGAEREFRKGLAARPDQTSGRAILGHVLLRQGRTAEARSELEAALDLNPTQPDALVLLATLDLQEGRFEEASRRASDGKRFYPHRAEFAYQAVMAAAGRGRGGPPPDISAALELARSGGPKMARSLAFVAAALGDDRTVAACRPLTGAGPGR